MAKDQFGTVFPRAKDIAAFDVENLITVDGEPIPRELYKINKAIGGCFSFVYVDEFTDTPHKQK